MEHSNGTTLLTVEGMCKSFAGLRALDDVSLTVGSGEIVAVVGHNGSGKSTLVKILGGIYTDDGGTVTMYEDGNHSAELHIIHQDLGLANQLTAVENMSISRKEGVRTLAPTRKKHETQHTEKLIARFGEPFDVNVPIQELAPAQRSIIAIARALDGWKHPRNVLILDEPTEALHASEVKILFDAVRKLKAEGAGIIFISHRLDEVLELADRIVVLRDGRKVADQQRDEIEHEQLVSLVTGATSEAAEIQHRTNEIGEVVLDIEGLSSAVIEDAQLQVREGEVVGIAGVLGSGREALPAVIFGSIDGEAQKFTLNGEPYVSRNPRESIRRGIAFVPGDRAKYGSVRPMTARENITLTDHTQFTNRVGALRINQEKDEAERLMANYGVRPPRSEQTFAQFSGGNQQKIVFAKWLRNRPDLLLLEEPTQGVDIGAKQAIYDSIDAVAEKGTAVLVCSSEAKELVRLCDRVFVFREGSIVAELAGEELTEIRLLLEGYGLQNEEKQ